MFIKEFLSKEYLDFEIFCRRMHTLNFDQGLFLTASHYILWLELLTRTMFDKSAKHILKFSYFEDVIKLWWHTWHGFSEASHKNWENNLNFAF